MNDFKTGTVVYITEGNCKGTIGIVDSISCHRSKIDGINQRYLVVTNDYPKGIVLSEKVMEEYNDYDPEQSSIYESTVSAPESVFREPSFIDIEGTNIKLALYSERSNLEPCIHFYKVVSKDKSISPRYLSEGGCLSLVSPNYISYNYHTDTLNEFEMKTILEYFKSDDTQNWDDIIATWNILNKDNKIPIYSSIPDYTTNMKSYHTPEVVK